jgi:hypothetical protein
MTRHPKPIHAGRSAREYDEAMAVKESVMPADLDLSEAERVRAEASAGRFVVFLTDRHGATNVVLLAGEPGDIASGMILSDANFLAYAANNWTAILSRLTSSQESVKDLQATIDHNERVRAEEIAIAKQLGFARGVEDAAAKIERSIEQAERARDHTLNHSVVKAVVTATLKALKDNILALKEDAQ